VPAGTGHGADLNLDNLPLDMVQFLEAVAVEGLWSPSIVANHGRHMTIRMVRSPDALAPGDADPAHLVAAGTRPCAFARLPVPTITA